MTFHAKNALRSASISKVFNLFLAVPTTEAASAESLISSENREILDLVTTGTTAVCTIIANERAVTEEKEVGIRIEEGITCVAAEAIDMPSVPS